MPTEPPVNFAEKRDSNYRMNIKMNIVIVNNP